MFVILGKNRTFGAMKSFLILICALFGLSCSNKNMVYAEGPVMADVRNVGEFKRIDVQSELAVTVSKSSSHNVSISSQANIIPYIETYVEDSVLTIKVKRETHIYGDVFLEISVSANFLDEVSTSSGGYIKFDCNAFSLETLKVNCTGGGRVELSGGIKKLTVNASQNSHIGSYDLACDAYLNLTLSEGSTAQMYLNGICDVALFKGSIFKYKGDGQIRQSNITDGSQIIKEE